MNDEQANPPDPLDLFDRVKHHSLPNQVRLLWNCVEELQKAVIPFAEEAKKEETKLPKK